MATVAKNTRSTTINLASDQAGPFSLGFRLFDTDAVRVYVDGVVAAGWTLSSSFLNGYDDAATITFAAAVASGSEIIIDAALAPWREANLVNGDENLVQNINIEFGRLWSAMAEARRDVDRSVRGFTAMDPVGGVDLTTIANAEGFADDAEASAVAAAASAAAASAAENSLVEWQGTWVTATAYAPSDVIKDPTTENTYICLMAHTSGTFATDLSGGKWELFLPKGAAGAGAGDVVAANNGTEFTAGTFRANLALFGALLTAETGADLLSRAASNPRGMAFYCSTGCTNTPPGYAAGDIFLSKGLDANNVSILYLRKDGVIFTNVRVSGTWTGWVQQATETSLAAAIDAQQQIIHVRDEKTSGTAGGTFSSGIMYARTLNTVVTNTISGASLSSNQITLPAGDYEIDAMAPAFAVGVHKAILYNVTDATEPVVGSSEVSSNPYASTTWSRVRGRFSIAGTKVFELRHRGGATYATHGFGFPATMARVEVYAEVMIRKL